MPLKKKEKRKFIPKEPILFGPFIHSDQIIPQILQSSSIQFIGNYHTWMNAHNHNPFSDYELVFSALEGSRKTSHDPSNPNIKESTPSTFPNHLLNSLITVIIILSV